MSKQGSNGTNMEQVCVNLHRNKAICGVFWVEWGSDTTFIRNSGILEISGQETAYLPLRFR
jgi:hypothetical protein